MPHIKTDHKRTSDRKSLKIIFYLWCYIAITSASLDGDTECGDPFTLEKQYQLLDEDVPSMYRLQVGINRLSRDSAVAYDLLDGILSRLSKLERTLQGSCDRRSSIYLKILSSRLCQRCRHEDDVTGIFAIPLLDPGLPEALANDNWKQMMTKKDPQLSKEDIENRPPSGLYNYSDIVDNLLTNQQQHQTISDVLEPNTESTRLYPIHDNTQTSKIVERLLGIGRTPLYTDFESTHEPKPKHKNLMDFNSDRQLNPDHGKFVTSDPFVEIISQNSDVVLRTTANETNTTSTSSNFEPPLQKQTVFSQTFKNQTGDPNETTASVAANIQGQKTTKDLAVGKIDETKYSTRITYMRLAMKESVLTTTRPDLPATTDVISTTFTAEADPGKMNSATPFAAGNVTTDNFSPNLELSNKTTAAHIPQYSSVANNTLSTNVTSSPVDGDNSETTDDFSKELKQDFESVPGALDTGEPEISKPEQKAGDKKGSILNVSL